MNRKRGKTWDLGGGTGGAVSFGRTEIHTRGMQSQEPQIKKKRRLVEKTFL